MNGKRAKAIAKRTREFLLALNISLGEGYNEYHQDDNCMSWELAKGRDGRLLKDPTGYYLRKPVMNPGTIRTKWKFRLFYRWLKRMYKAKDEGALVILNATPDELIRLAGIMEEQQNVKQLSS